MYTCCTCLYLHTHLLLLLMYVVCICSSVVLCVNLIWYDMIWTFSVDPEFSLRGKFMPKITIFRDFGGCKPTFLQPQRWNLARDCGPGTPSPSQILYKSLKGLYPLWANLYKKYQFWRFWSPHFRSDNGEIWREGTNFVKIAQVDLSFMGKFLPKIRNFRDF